MSPFKIAHIKEQGVNVIIVPLASRYGKLSVEEKDALIQHFQNAATAMQWSGRVVPMWMEGKGIRFIAPPEWYEFFRTLKWKVLMRNLNRELVCPEAEAAGVNPMLTGKEGMGMFEKLGQWLIDTAKGLMDAVAAGAQEKRK